MTRWVLSLIWLLAVAPLKAEEQAWLLVDTTVGTLSVMRGERVLSEFDDVSVGRGGVSPLRVQGDNSTPLGDFRVLWINTDSRYHRFYGFDYPTLEHAVPALELGLIDKPTYGAIAEAADRQRLPPQDTALGGNLGIHGLGNGDLRIHEAFNWTNGCIALTNEQINALDPWIRVGTRVVVR